MLGRWKRITDFIINEEKLSWEQLIIADTIAFNYEHQVSTLVLL